MGNPISRSINANTPQDVEVKSLAQINALRVAHSPWRDAWIQFRKRKLAVFGLVMFIFIVLSTLIGPFLWTKSHSTVDFLVASQGPSLEHPFGTNDLGQDLLARVLYGGRVSVTVGIAAMLIGVILGSIVGSLAGFFGKWIDTALMRLTDVFLALPQLPLLLLIIYLFRDAVTKVLGPELGIFVLVVLVIGLLNWMSLARLVRANFLTLRESEFVAAAHAMGVPEHRIILRHMLPNTMGPIIVAATLAVGAAIITESSLSFLGLGFPPDTPTWGRMLNESQNYIEFTPWMAIFPGIFIFLTVLSINYIGDGLRDALDPQLRGRMNGK